METGISNGKSGAGGEAPAHQTRLLTLLFTDIVHSTALKHQLGDPGSAALMERHHALVREVLRAFPEGEEIETAGDSFLLLFGTPSSSVRFALVLQARLREWNRHAPALVQDRIGIHSGEIVVRKTDEPGKSKRLGGLHVDLTARVMSLARGGQILLTRDVFDSARQVLKGEDIQGLNPLAWLNHGPYLLKGIEDPIEVCEVLEQGWEPLGVPQTSEKAHRHTTAESEPVLGWRPAVGQAVPNTQWILERQLGEGGFGEVWLGRHQTMKERRVFKFCFEANRVRSLKQEMMLFRLIKERIGDHPNIVGLRDVNFEAPPFYVEMDYAAGQDLRSWCEAQGGLEKLTLEVRLEIVAQAADGLQAAHDAGVMHRDIKPANILVCQVGHPPLAPGTPPQASQRSVTAPGESSEAAPGPRAPALNVKLTDFGIGQVISEEYLSGVTHAGFTRTLLSSSSSLSGTQLYMAPELLAGKPGSIRSDIYSLGVVLYQLLVGDFSQPVTGDWANDIQDPLLREDLKHCLAGKPDDRYTGAGQLANSLRAWPRRRKDMVQRQAEQAEREELRRQAERRHKLLLVSGTVALVMVALAVALSYGMRRARRERDQQRRLAYAANMRAADAAMQEGNLGQVADLLERHLPQSGVEDLRGVEWRYLWQVGRSEDAGGFQYPAVPHSGDLSPDGRWVITSGLDGWVRIHNTEGKEVVRYPSGYTKGAMPEPTVAFSPQGDWVAAATTTNILIWDTRQWQLQRCLPCPVAVIAFSPDGRLLAAIGNRGLQVWSTRTWEPEVAPGDRPVTRVGYQQVAFSPDNSLIAIGNIYDPTVILWSLANRTIVATNLSIAGAISLAISPDGRWLASGSSLGQVKVWNLASRALSAELPNRTPWVLGLAFSPDSQVLATAGADQQIHLWQAGTTNHLRQFKGHRGEIWWLRYAADGQWLFSGSADRTVRRWSPSAPSTGPRQLSIPTDRLVLDLASQGTRAQMLNPQNQTIEEWDLTHTNILRQVKLQDLPSDFQAIDMVRELGHRHLACYNRRGFAKVFDTRTGFQVFPPHSQTNGFLAACISSDDRWLAGTERTNGLWLGGVWDLKEGHRRLTLPDLAPDANITGNAVFSPDGSLLAYETVLHRINLYDFASARTRSLPGHSRPLYALRFSPDGRWLASSSWDATTRVWDVASGQPVTPWLVGHRSGVDSIHFSADGRTLVTRSASDMAFRFWHLPTGTELLGSRRMPPLRLSVLDALGSDDTMLIEGIPASDTALLLTPLPQRAEIDAQIKASRLVRVGSIEP